MVVGLNYSASGDALWFRLGFIWVMKGEFLEDQLMVDICISSSAALRGHQRPLHATSWWNSSLLGFICFPRSVGYVM